MEIYSINVNDIKNADEYGDDLAHFGRDIAKHAIEKDGYHKRTMKSGIRDERYAHVVIYDNKVRVKMLNHANDIPEVTYVGKYLLVNSGLLIEVQ